MRAESYPRVEPEGREIERTGCVPGTGAYLSGLVGCGWKGRPRLFLLACMATIGATTVACIGTDDQKVTAQREATLAVLERTIGTVEGTSEQHFASVSDFLAIAEGDVWVLDGVGPRLTPRLRRYDSNGAYLGEVGGLGEGPGEFRRPYALAELLDGRVVVRDQLAPDRLLLFRSDGTYDTTWSFDRPLNNVPGNPSVMGVGRSGVLWVEDRRTVRPEPGAQDVPPVVYIRIGQDGSVIDTVVPPAPAEVDRPARVGGLVVLPFQPTAISHWSPSGAFVTGSTDEYAVRMTRVPNPGSEARSTGQEVDTDTEYTIRRDTDPVPISREEQEAVRSDIRRVLRSFTEQAPPAIDVPNTKPALRGAFFDDDGRLWVHLSVPSRLREARPEGMDEPVAKLWEEPDVFDVYGKDASLVGRVELPPDACARRPRPRGDYLWCEARGPFDVEVLRRFRIDWD